MPRAPFGYVLTLGSSQGSPVRGWMLLDELEVRCRAAGASEIWVDTESENARALSFYGRAGFEVVQRRFGQVLMRKPVRRPLEAK